MHQATVDILRIESYPLSEWHTEKREERSCVSGRGGDRLVELESVNYISLLFPK